MGAGEEIPGRCGCCRCDLCPAYNGNIKSFADRQRVSEGWLRYFGLDIPPEEVGCVGCLNDGKLMDATCPIRPCVLGTGIGNCALCDAFTCDNLKSLLEFVEKAAASHRDAPEEDYNAFIRPYQNRGRLMRLREAWEKREERPGKQ